MLSQWLTTVVGDNELLINQGYVIVTHVGSSMINCAMILGSVIIPVLGPADG